MISFVIPAHNEEACLGATLDALIRAARQAGVPFEVIVANDASTDRTGAIARERGVRVVEVRHRQIAAARNAGARVARGEILFFVDADTEPSVEAIRAGLEALQEGAVGGGCVFRYNGPVPWWAHILLPIGNTAGRLLKLIGGCFLFCPRSEFDAVGGFSERYYAAEEVVFVKALKSRGRFVIPRVSVLTSNRKLRGMPLRRALRELFRFVVHGPKGYRSREGLDLWYGSEAREQPAPGGTGRHMSIGTILKALVEQRERRVFWFYTLWLAGYCVLAFTTTIYAAVLGQDYHWPLFVLLVPAVAGCVQLRFPTLLGWVVLFFATALAGLVALCVFPWLVKGTLATGDWWQVLVGALVLAAIGAVLYGLVRHRPVPMTRTAESGRPEEDPRGPR